MSLNPFSSNIISLSEQAQGIEYTSNALIASLKGRGISIAKIEESHIEITQLYNKTMGEISSLKEKIQQGTNYSNEEEMFMVTSLVTEIESTIEKVRNQLNDNILTYCPTAKIAYGARCIGPKKAPVLETTDRKMNEMISKCSCIREIRGDGNCFVSALTTRFLETLAERGAIGEFIAFIFDDGITEPDLKEEILGTLTSLQEYPSQKENILGDNHKILPFIKYFRLLAADEMKNNPLDFEVYFRADVEQFFDEAQEEKPYEDLIAQYVLKMGVDFSHPSITALCQRLKFCVNIIDPKVGNPEGFKVLGSQPAQGTFCRNGAHYFVLYTKEEAETISPHQAAPIAQVEAPSKDTEIIIHCKIPFGHTLFIRGSGSVLNWERGIPLKPIGDDAWIFQSSTPLDNIACKFLVDDTFWESGKDRKITQGKIDGETPQFTLPSNMEIMDAPVPPVPTTKITIKYDAGYGNKLFIRGSGPGMSWQKGIELKNAGGNIWVYDTQENFANIEYKILLNDKSYEVGENHKTGCGKKEEITPKF